VAKEIFERRFNLELVFSIDSEKGPNDFVIYYGVEEGDLQIPPCGLLEENQQLVFNFPWTKFELMDNLTIAQNTLSIDVFGVVFWFISRYEECQFHGPYDEYDRFPSSASLINTLGLLDFPVVDHLLHEFSNLLKNKGLDVFNSESNLEISFDIDNGTAYNEKGLLRNVLGFGKDLFLLRFKKIFQRSSVLLGHSKDPFDHFEKILKVPQNSKSKNCIFFWIGDYGKNDKGLHWKNLWIRKWIKELANVIEIGIHPSFNSYGNAAQFSIELERLESITAQKISKNRFHFLRFHLPESYQMLESKAIEEDYSMGYSDVFGYRAGTGLAFFWYDLKNERATNLKIHPFVMMDSLAYFKLKLNAAEFLDEVKRFHSQATRIGGKVHVIFHNEHFAWKSWENIVSHTSHLNQN